MKYRCLSTLVDIKAEGYSSAARKQLAGGGRKFPHRLPFGQHDIVEIRIKTIKHMSISGVQDKISLKLMKGQLTETGMNGEYILKPIPSSVVPSFGSDVPANEHLTMQVAAQVFRIHTAINACIYLKDGELAYITKRFDHRNEKKIAQEDFCQLTNRSMETDGKHFKYSGTYEELGQVLREFCKAYAVEIEKLYNLILFDYVFSNGDAHLKNFSLHKSIYGDYVLTPAYDLICSSMHFSEESRMALDLFNDFETATFRQNGFYGQEDFIKLAELYGVRLSRAQQYINRFLESQDQVCHMIDRSFMSQEAIQDYKERFKDRIKAISIQRPSDP